MCDAIPSLKFAIIVLNWNNSSDTLECLASLAKITYPAYEVIVVDNGSTDDSVLQIQANYPDHHLIETGENLGFAEGNNRGILEAKKRGAEMILLLNNDTVVAPTLLSELAKGAEKHPKVGVFGPKIYFYDEPATLWYAGGGVDPKSGRCFHVGCGLPDSQKYKEKSLTDYVCGCALAIRSEVVDQVGLLDPRFFLIWEEIDWCYRARKAGFDCLVVPSARVWHKVSASFIEGNRGPMWNYYYFRNRLLFHRKHSPWRKRWKRAGLRELARLPKKEARAARHGVLDYLLGRFGKGRLSKFTQI